jgi:predicted NUDIX family phosphoesterase
MQFILVIDRRYLFPGLAPQGFLPLDAVDLALLENHAFFAERAYMERCSHYKQIIPYVALTLDGDILCYQRRTKHTESRLGGLWTIGFGGHMEPRDRQTKSPGGFIHGCALRELEEETGLSVKASDLKALGYINSEREEVSQVHFGVFFALDLRDLGRSKEEIATLVSVQTEPHRVSWQSRSELHPAHGVPTAPAEGQWEDWTLYALQSGVLRDTSSLRREARGA